MSFTLCSEHEGKKNSFSVRRVEMEIFVLAKASGSHTWRHQLFEIPIKPFPFSWHWNWKRHDGVAYVCVWLCVSVKRVDKRRSGSVLGLLWQVRGTIDIIAGSRVQVFNVKRRVSFLGFPTHTSVYSRRGFYFCYCYCYFIIIIIIIIHSIRQSILFTSLNRTVFKDYYYS
jgi:hypothetical protein